VPARHVPHRKGPWPPRSFIAAKASIVVTIYADVMSDGPVMSGTLVESQSHDSSPTGTAVVSGTRVEGLVHASVMAGTVVASATEIETLVFSDVMAGTVVASGVIVESYVPGGGGGGVLSHGPTKGVF
jgi:hypothetical protein